jgi:arylsulfatase A
MKFFFFWLNLFLPSTLFLTSCTKNKYDVLSVAHPDNISPPKPNIILVLMDDFGYELPGFTGGQSYPTPNLDLLSQVGRRYVSCHSSPLCSPSRVELMTGLYNFRNYTKWGYLDTSNTTIANILKKAGYATCVAGKWQFDGGDVSIRKFGFDKYSVWNAFSSTEAEADAGSHYKNPVVYQNGAFLADSLTQGKYGEDIFRKYAFDFIDSSKGKPFFLYWAPNLCHVPCTPTPDDPEFAAWVAGNNTKYFPSMVKYMDKEIGMLKAKIDTIPNTIVIIMGDNGTYGKITSMWNGKSIVGGKNKTDETGTRTPMILYSTNGGFTGIDSTLIDFSDFFPTLATMAEVDPLSYKTDGYDFLSKKRTSIFQHFQYKGEEDPSLRYMRWAQNHSYKLYDTVTSIPPQAVTGNLYRVFYNFGQKDRLLTQPYTEVDQRNYNTLKQVLLKMHN